MLANWGSLRICDRCHVRRRISWARILLDKQLSTNRVTPKKIHRGKRKLESIFKYVEFSVITFISRDKWSMAPKLYTQENKYKRSLHHFCY